MTEIIILSYLIVWVCLSVNDCTARNLFIWFLGRNVCLFFFSEQQKQFVNFVNHQICVFFGPLAIVTPALGVKIVPSAFIVDPFSERFRSRFNGPRLQKQFFFVISEVIKNTGFDEATRTSALEIVCTLAENMAAILRKHQDALKDHLFPALAQMMTEVTHDEDLKSWYEEEDTELQAKNDPASVAADSLQRMSVFLGEKTTLACSTHLIQGAIASS